MKRIVIVAVIAALATLPASASDLLLNLGYNLQQSGLTFSRRSISFVFTSLGGDAGGFYAQVAPYFALSSKSWEFFGSYATNYCENDIWGGGLTFTLGYGRDFNYGQFGLLVGGGFFGNLYVQHDTYSEHLYYDLAAGIGGGAHLYFQPGKGPVGFNVGLDMAWRPVEGYGYAIEGFDYVPEDFNFNFNAGITIRH